MNFDNHGSKRFKIKRIYANLKKRSISRDLTIGLILTTVVVSTLTLSLSYFRASERASKQLENKANEYTNSLSEALKIPIWNLDEDAITHIGQSYIQNELVQNLIIKDAWGKVYFEKEKETEASILTKAGDIRHEGEFAGSFELSLTSSYTEEINRQFVWSSVYTVLANLLSLVIVTGFLFRKFLNRPLHQVRKIVDSYTSGEYKLTSMQSSPCIEFQPLLDVLCDMGDKIEFQMQNIQKAEKKYREIFENAIEGIFQINPEGHFISSNPAMARLLGFDSPKELINDTNNTNFQQYVYEGKQKKLINLMQSGGNSSEFEIQLRRNNHEIIWAAIKTRPVFDQKESLIYIDGLAEDITSRKQAEKKLEEHRHSLEDLVKRRTRELSVSNDGLEQEVEERRHAELELLKTKERLQHLLSSSPAVIYSKNSQDGFHATFVSENVKSLLGYKPDVFLKNDRFWAEQLHPEDKARILSGLKIICDNGCRSQEYRFRHKDRSFRWLLDESILIKNSDSNSSETIGSWIDITERKQAEAKIELLHKQLNETSRRAGMSEIATGVLHNVGNVLNSVNVSAEVVTGYLKNSRVSNLEKVAVMIRDNLECLDTFLTEDEKGKLLPSYIIRLAELFKQEQEATLSEMDSLTKNLDHIKEIVSAQQTYAGVSGIAEEISISDVIEDSLNISKAALQRHNVTIIRDFEQTSKITVEKHKVVQILINLIGNAKHALENVDDREKVIILHVELNNNRVSIEVSDNGIGIPEENLIKIFAHGFTTRQKGHGFGLHSAALAANELGGSLTVNSDGIGKGAIFSLDLPAKLQSLNLKNQVQKVTNIENTGA